MSLMWLIELPLHCGELDHYGDREYLGIKENSHSKTNYQMKICHETLFFSVACLSIRSFKLPVRQSD